MNAFGVLLIIVGVIMVLVAIFCYGYNEGYRNAVNRMEEMYIDRKYERKDKE